MTDIVDAEGRSRMMAGIKGRNTQPELVVRQYLHRAGLRFRLQVKGLPGRPDIVLPKHGTVVFVHGCFWHRHPGCKFAATPSTRVGFWQSKFTSNVARDAACATALCSAGWSVQTVWECETRDALALDRLVWCILAR